MTDQPPVPAPIDRDQMARIAAAAARSVPGVARLQPNLKHVVGRAARELFAGLTTTGTASDAAAETEPTGVDIDRGPDGVDVTIRIVSGTSPAPHQVALGVQRAVTDALVGAELSARVVVVVVDVEA